MNCKESFIKHFGEQLLNFRDAAYPVYKMGWEYGIEHECVAIMQTLDELWNSEAERNAMFSDGYNLALSHIGEFIKRERHE